MTNFPGMETSALIWDSLTEADEIFHFLYCGHKLTKIFF